VDDHARPYRAVISLDLTDLAGRDAAHTDLTGTDDVQSRPELEAGVRRPHGLGVDVDPAAVMADGHVVAGTSRRASGSPHERMAAN
jgi:hypothetical protein